MMFRFSFDSVVYVQVLIFSCLVVSLSAQKVCEYDVRPFLASRLNAVLELDIPVKKMPKMPAATGKALRTVLDELRDRSHDERSFLEEHMPIWQNKVSKEYKERLRNPVRSYRLMLSHLPDDLKDTYKDFRTYALSLPIKGGLTWQKALVSGAILAIIVGGGLFAYHKLGKGDNGLSIKNDQASRKIVSLFRRRQREAKILENLIIEPDQARVTQGPFAIDSNTYAKFQNLAKQVKDGFEFSKHERMEHRHLVAHSVHDTVPKEWCSLTRDGEVYKAATGGIIKIARWGKTRKRSNVTRALNAFRVKAVAPTMHAWRAQKEKLPTTQPLAQVATKGRVRDMITVPDLAHDEWQVFAPLMRIVPLKGTITPAQARKTNQKASPIDDMHYLVVAQDVAEHLIPYKGYKTGVLGCASPARLEQVITVGSLIGSDDLHAGNVCQVDASDPDSKIIMIDLEKHAGAIRNEHASKQKVIAGLYYKTQSEYVGKKLGETEQDINYKRWLAIDMYLLQRVIGRLIDGVLFHGRAEALLPKKPQDLSDDVWRSVCYIFADNSYAPQQLKKEILECLDKKGVSDVEKTMKVIDECVVLDPGILRNSYKTQWKKLNHELPELTDQQADFLIQLKKAKDQYGWLRAGDITSDQVTARVPSFQEFEWLYELI